MIRTAIAAVLASAVAATAWAQDGRGWQVGVDYSAIGLYSDWSGGTGVHGLGARVDVPLTLRVDVEGRLTWFPAETPTGQTQGGRTVIAALGMRGRFIARRRASLYGVLLPELLHSSKAAKGVGPDDVITGGATHFALDWGLGTEIAIGRRWVAHAELTGPLYAVRGFELGRSEPGPQGQVLVASLSPLLRNVWQVTAGASVIVGGTKNERDERPVRGRWTVGGQLGMATVTDAFMVEDVWNISTIGGFASWRIAPATYADGAVNLFLRNVNVHTPFSGGRVTQALGGVKLGTRKDGYGIFAKVRVGVDSHSAATKTLYAFARYNATAIDTGAVFERYLGAKWLVRFDGGDVISVFHPTDITYRGLAQREPAPRATDSLQMSAGVGWRF